MKKEFLTINLKDLKPHPKNPKDHDVEAIKESIKANGALDPIEVDEKNVILAGHGRQQALLELGYEEDTVVRYTGLTEAQKEDYVLRANTTTMRRGFLDEKLKLFDRSTLESAGFGSTDMDRIFQVEEDAEDEFNAQERYEKIRTAKTERGDLYQLGKHRLHCGDSTLPEDVARLMGKEKADMVFMDPPYNVNYRTKKKKENIMNDDMDAEAFIAFTAKFMERMRDVLKSGGVYYICSGFSSYAAFVYSVHACGLKYSGPIVWVKNQFSMGYNDYRHQYEVILKGKTSGKKHAEMILYGWNGGAHYFKDDRTEADVWEFKRKAGATMVHPTQKPIALVNRAIKIAVSAGRSYWIFFVEAAPLSYPRKRQSVFATRRNWIRNSATSSSKDGKP